jgi:hypothetical protein
MRSPCFLPAGLRMPVQKKNAALGKLQAMIVISHFQFSNLNQISNLKSQMV